MATTWVIRAPSMIGLRRVSKESRAAPLDGVLGSASWRDDAETAFAREPAGAPYAAALPPPLPPRGSLALEHALPTLFQLFGSSTSPSSTLWHTFLHEAQMK